MKYDVADLSLAGVGKKRILWADNDMPVLAAIRNRFAKSKPLKGKNVSACLHITAETANLARTLKAGGANVVLCGSNPLSTQDDVAASLVKDFGIGVFAVCGENNATYYKHINAAIDHKPVITFDGSPERNHIATLKDKGVYYSNGMQLVNIFKDFRKEPQKDWNAYKDFSPEKVMAKFDQVFLNQL